MRSTPRFLVGLASVAVGCAPPPSETSGHLDLCFVQDDVDRASMEEARFHFEAASVGEVDPELSPCPSMTEVRRFERRDGGAVWLGWRVIDGQERDRTPMVDVPIGTAVQLTHEISVSEAGEHNAVSMVGEDGLWFAGKDWSAEPMPDEDLDGLVVAMGDDEYAAPGSCGRERAFLTHFGELALGHGQDGRLQHNGIDLHAHNLASWRYQRSVCADTWGPWTWLVVRTP